MILIGNKCDNHKSPTKSLNEKANNISQNVLKCFHIETSAKENKNVE